MVYAPGDSLELGFLYIIHRGLALYCARVRAYPSSQLAPAPYLDRGSTPFARAAPTPLVISALVAGLGWA